jgi:hypothetical protein
MLVQPQSRQDTDRFIKATFDAMRDADDARAFVDAMERTWAEEHAALSAVEAAALDLWEQVSPPSS